MYRLISIETGIDKHICLHGMLDQLIQLRPNEHYLVCVSFGSKLNWEIIELIKTSVESYHKGHAAAT